jgi:signal peptidase
VSRLAALVAGVVYGVAVVVVVLVAAPAVMGWRSLTVMSGSMEPTISTGDVVVTRPTTASSIHAGRVITFRDPADSGRLLTHRVRRVTHHGASTDVVTQGDANTGVERWSMATDGHLGVVVYRVPRIGYVLHPAQSPMGRIVLVGVPVLLWGVLVLRGIWADDREPGDADIAVRDAVAVAAVMAGA